MSDPLTWLVNKAYMQGDLEWTCRFWSPTGERLACCHEHAGCCGYNMDPT